MTFWTHPSRTTWGISDISILIGIIDGVTQRPWPVGIGGDPIAAGFLPRKPAERINSASPEVGSERFSSHPSTTSVQKMTKVGLWVAGAAALALGAAALPEVEYTEFVQVEPTDQANAAQWRTWCKKVPTNADHVRVTIGDYTDYFRPVNEYVSICDMLLSHIKHTWSPSGKPGSFQTIRPFPSASNYGGSQGFEPQLFSDQRDCKCSMTRDPSST
jgi:hypothetical protein